MSYSGSYRSFFEKISGDDNCKIFNIVMLVKYNLLVNIFPNLILRNHRGTSFLHSNKMVKKTPTADFLCLDIQQHGERKKMEKWKMVK